MTIRELVEALKALEKCDDPELAHAEADALLLKYIADAEVDFAFAAIDKWYA